MKKLPHELELEELLAAVKDTDLEDIKVSYDDPILSFTQAFNLIPGDDLVSNDLLYKLFSLWYPETVFGRANFSRQIGKYLPRENKFYKVNKNFLSISKQIQEMLRAKKRKKVKSKTWTNHYHAFLDDTGLAPGSIYVESDIVYYVYNRWRDSNNKKSLLSYEAFLDFCGLHFTTKNLSTSNKKWYGMNKAIKSLITREEVERWRESKRNAKNRLYKKRTEILFKKEKQKTKK